jgi:hypothetical protein
MTDVHQGYQVQRITLTDAFEFELELAVYASSLFIAVVQDRFELGGGYGLQIIALDTLINKHFDELEQVEDYLAEAIPYKKHSDLWIPLPSVHFPGKSGIAYLKRLLEKEQA